MGRRLDDQRDTVDLMLDTDICKISVELCLAIPKSILNIPYTRTLSTSRLAAILQTTLRSLHQFDHVGDHDTIHSRFLCSSGGLSATLRRCIASRAID